MQQSHIIVNIRINKFGERQQRVNGKLPTRVCHLHKLKDCRLSDVRFNKLMSYNWLAEASNSGKRSSCVN